MTTKKLQLRKELIMSIFKRRKAKEFFKNLNGADFVVIPPDVPVVVKKSVIKPTKCKACLTIYQANHSQIKSERDIGYIHPKYNLFAECPICHNFNEVEFEEGEG
jgi:hypothetical protein